MGTTYEYTYEYEVSDSNKHARSTGGNTGSHSHRTTGHHSNFGTSHANMDPLINLQHDRIWNKLYDPLNIDKASQETETQVCRKLIVFLLFENPRFIVR